MRVAFLGPKVKRFARICGIAGEHCIPFAKVRCVTDKRCKKRYGRGWKKPLPRLGAIAFISSACLNALYKPGFSAVCLLVSVNFHDGIHSAVWVGFRGVIIRVLLPMAVHDKSVMVSPFYERYPDLPGAIA